MFEIFRILKIRISKNSAARRLTIGKILIRTALNNNYTWTTVILILFQKRQAWIELEPQNLYIIKYMGPCRNFAFYLQTGFWIFSCAGPEKIKYYFLQILIWTKELDNENKDNI